MLRTLFFLILVMTLSACPSRPINIVQFAGDLRERVEFTRCFGLPECQPMNLAALNSCHALSEDELYCFERSTGCAVGDSCDDAIYKSSTRFFYVNGDNRCRTYGIGINEGFNVDLALTLGVFDPTPEPKNETSKPPSKVHHLNNWRKEGKIRLGKSDTQQELLEKLILNFNEVCK